MNITKKRNQFTNKILILVFYFPEQFSAKFFQKRIGEKLSSFSFSAFRFSSRKLTSTKMNITEKRNQITDKISTK